MRDFRPAGMSDSGQVNSNSHVAPGDGFRPSTHAAIPYKADDSRAKKCIAKDNTCNGYKLKDSDYCSGHARSKAKGRVAE